MHTNNNTLSLSTSSLHFPTMHIPQIMLAKMQYLALLLLFGLVVTAVTVTKEDADVGKVTGFTHNDLSSFGSDYLSSTFCYCGYGMDLNDTKYDEAHYFQFEYYNKHLNTTFIDQHHCFKTVDDKHTCYAPRSEDGSLDLGWKFDWSGGVCKSWPRYHYDDRNRFVDEFCYVPHYGTGKHQGDDYITYNKQKRDVGRHGGQGYQQLDDEAANSKCERLCYDQTDMPLMEGNELAKSRIIVNDHIDDMCDHCK